MVYPSGLLDLCRVPHLEPKQYKNKAMIIIIQVGISFG